MSGPRGTLISLPGCAGSVDELLLGVESREPLPNTVGKSGATLERVVIDGRMLVLKHLRRDEDWTMRAAGVLSGATSLAWSRGLFDRLPPCFAPVVVGVALTPHGCAILMHDVQRWLVPAVDDAVPLAQHRDFLDAMAALHAAFWEVGPDAAIVPEMHRYLDLSPWTADAENWLGSDHLVPRLIASGWPQLTAVAPRAAAVVLPLATDPGPLVEALAGTPRTFVHGNWKLDNLGTDDRGRTVLLDWELPGFGAPLSDLAWYLAINCRRLPESKEAAIEAYRQSLTGHGVDTHGWWDTQLELALLGALVQFGWEKALSGYDDELVWWERHALAGAARLGS